MWVSSRNGLADAQFDQGRIAAALETARATVELEADPRLPSSLLPVLANSLSDVAALEMLAQARRQSERWVETRRDGEALCRCRTATRVIRGPVSRSASSACRHDSCPERPGGVRRQTYRPRTGPSLEGRTPSAWAAPGRRRAQLGTGVAADAAHARSHRTLRRGGGCGDEYVPPVSPTVAADPARRTAAGPRDARACPVVQGRGARRWSRAAPR